MGKWLIVAGAVLIVVGALLTYAPSTLGWFGKLPGDIDYRSGNTRVFVPITSMILISVVLSVIVNLLRR